MKRIRRSLSLTPKDRATIRTSLYEDTFPGEPPEIGDYPVKGNTELPEHMRRTPYSERTSRAPQRTTDTSIQPSRQVSGNLTSPRESHHSASIGADPRTTRSQDGRLRTAPSPVTPASQDRGVARVDLSPSAPRGRMRQGEADLAAGMSDLSLHRESDLSSQHRGKQPPRKPATTTTPHFTTGQYSQYPAVQPRPSPATQTSEQIDGVSPLYVPGQTRRDQTDPRAGVNAFRRDSEDALPTPAIQPADLKSSEYAYLEQVFGAKGSNKSLPNPEAAELSDNRHAQPRQRDQATHASINQADVAEPRQYRSPVSPVSTIATQSQSADYTSSPVKRSSDDRPRIAPIPRKKVGSGSVPAEQPGTTGSSRPTQARYKQADSAGTTLRKALPPRDTHEHQSPAQKSQEAVKGGAYSSATTEEIPARQRQYDILQRAGPSQKPQASSQGPAVAAAESTSGDPGFDNRKSPAVPQQHKTWSSDPSLLNQQNTRATTTSKTQKPSLEGVVDLRDSVDTEVITRQAPAVTHDTVLPKTTQIREEVITREHHYHHVYHRVQPIIDIQVLPPRHFVPVYGGLKEVRAEDIPGRQEHWQIVETVTPDQGGPLVPTQDMLPSHEPIMESTRSFTSPEGIPCTETVWRHAPTLETGARDTGQSWPMRMDARPPRPFGTVATPNRPRTLSYSDSPRGKARTSAPTDSHVTRTTAPPGSGHLSGPHSVHGLEQNPVSNNEEARSHGDGLATALGGQGSHASISLNQGSRSSVTSSRINAHPSSPAAFADKPGTSLPTEGSDDDETSHGRKNMPGTSNTLPRSYVDSDHYLGQSATTSGRASSDIETNVPAMAQPARSDEDQSRSSHLQDPAQRSLDLRPRSRDYSRMSQPPQDYYPAVAGAALQGGYSDSPTAGSSDEYHSSYDKSTSTEHQARGLHPDGRYSAASESSGDYPQQKVSSGVAEQGPTPPNVDPSLTSANGTLRSRQDSLPISPQTPTMSSGSHQGFHRSSADPGASESVSAPSPSDVSGASLHNPASETDDNEGLIPVDLSTVGGLSERDMQGLIPVDHPHLEGAPEDNGSSWKMLRTNNPTAVDPRRPRMRDFAKDYIKSIAGTSADTPGPNTVPGAFPGTAAQTPAPTPGPDSIPGGFPTTPRP